jgi:WhiB family transcriptional regulator, redox-sensing transcriptional regulator
VLLRWPGSAAAYPRVTTLCRPRPSRRTARWRAFPCRTVVRRRADGSRTRDRWSVPRSREPSRLGVSVSWSCSWQASPRLGKALSAPPGSRAAEVAVPWRTDAPRSSWPRPYAPAVRTTTRPIRPATGLASLAFALDQCQAGDSCVPGAVRTLRFLAACHVQREGGDPDAGTCDVLCLRRRPPGPGTFRGPRAPAPRSAADAVTAGQLARLPNPVFSSYEWQFYGACADADATVFFHPEGERGPARRQRDAAALAVCAACPVVPACRAHALAVREPYGVWGGLSESDREAIHSQEGGDGLGGRGIRSSNGRSPSCPKTTG